MPDQISNFVQPPNSLHPADHQDRRLQEVARDLEASFLAEMLKAAKFGEPRQSFGGGIGEEHFASFLREEVSKDMVATGGIGLAEHLFETLKSRAIDG